MHDLLEFCHDHTLSHINLLGHSMGGKTSMKFAQNFPDFVEKLIVADIAPKQYPVHHKMILAGLSEVDFEKVKSRGEVDQILAKFIPEIGVRQFLMKSIYWESKGKLALRFNLKSIKTNIQHMGSKIDDQVFKGPTLFIRGNKSSYIIDDDLKQIESLFPNCELATIEEAGHWLHAEKPQEFLNKTLDFLLD